MDALVTCCPQKRMVVSTATETCVQQPPSSGKTSKTKKTKRSSSSGKSRTKSSSKSAQQAETYYDQPRHASDTVTHKLSSVDDHLYDVVRPRGNGAEDDGQNTYQNVTAGDQRAVYQNLDDMYDRPAHRNGRHSSKEKKSKKSSALVVQSHYQNLTFDDQQEEEDSEDHTYLNIDSRTYDVPRTDPSSIYDHPRNCGNNGGSTDYDYPKGLIPLSARLLLNASRKNKDGVDTDSLPENDSSDEGLTELRSGSSPDEGIGTELDPKGLSAIAEEEETSLTNVVENCYSNLPPLVVVQQPSKIKKSRSSKSKTSTKDSESNGNNHHSSETKTHKTSKSRRHHKTDGSSTQVDNSPSLAVNEPSNGNEEKTPQTDRCIEVYHETLRQRNSHKLMKAKIRELVSVQSAKEDSDNHSTIRRMKKLLPSVRALRSQFEPKNPQTGPATLQPPTGNNNTKEPVRKWKSTSNFQAVISCDPAAMEVIERINRSRSNSMGSLSTDEAMSSSASCSSKASSSHNQSIYPPPRLPEESELDHAVSTVSIIQQIIPDSQEKEYDMYRPRHSTAQWNPTSLLEDLYKIQQLPSSDELQKKDKEEQEQVINIEGALDKLPSGRRKATFWNAWKRRYFQVKDGQIYCYQNSQSEKPSIILQLVGGQVELDNNMISIDDGKGHYMVVRGSSKVETDRWHQALLSQVNGGRQVQNFVQPRAIEPKLLKEVIVLDLGSSSVRAGILSAQASLPQVFFPSVAAVDKSTGQMIAFGMQATLPEVRSHSSLAYPLRPSNKISKYMLDIEGVTGLIRTAFRQLNVDPSHYGIQVSLPRHLNHATQAELARLLFDEFGLQSVNLTHQSVLSLLSYNSTSGIVVDIGERIDIVPIMDGYMLESGASQVPYGGQQLVDHLRHFLVQQRCSLITEVESYIIRHILEKVAYVAGPDVGSYAIELNKAKSDPASVRGTVDLRPFSNGQLPWENVSLDLGRFQVTEGLFHPEAWGLDNPGIQKLVHKAIMDCSVDIRKEMVRSIYLSGGITLLPNFPERLEAELNRLTPSHLVPKVHAHPYRYHSSFIGACVLSNSPAYDQSRIKREEWIKGGPETARKWKP